MFVNSMPRYEILSADAIAVLDRGWRRIVSEIGVQFAKPEAVELFAKAGQRVDGEVVFLDPEFVLEQVAKAPREFDVQARNPAHNVHIGGDHMVFSSVYGCPFIREGDVRRDATLNDFRQLCMLSQAYDELDSAGGVICEPNDAPLDSRHLDMIYALATLTDKFYMGNVVSGPNAADTIAMTSILFGGREAIERAPPRWTSSRWCRPRSARRPRCPCRPCWSAWPARRSCPGAASRAARRWLADRATSQEVQLMRRPATACTAGGSRSAWRPGARRPRV